MGLHAGQEGCLLPDSLQPPPQAGAIPLQHVQGAARQPAVLRHTSGTGCGLSQTLLDITSGQSSERDCCSLGCISNGQLALAAQGY